MEQVYRNYGAGGDLVILGFNCADDKEVVTRFLRQNAITFPNIVDSSDAAKKLFFAEYQKPAVTAVPLSYIIDREGKIVEGWYDYHKGDERGLRVLKKLGVQ